MARKQIFLISMQWRSFKTEDWRLDLLINIDTIHPEEKGLFHFYVVIIKMDNISM